jgi:hypothetical protein
MAASRGTEIECVKLKIKSSELTGAFAPHNLKFL